MGKCSRCHGHGVEPDWPKLGRELRRRRVKAEMGLREAARRAEVSPAHLSDMEKGRRSMGGPKASRVLGLFGLDIHGAFPTQDTDR